MAEMRLDQRTQGPKAAMIFHDLKERIVAKTAAAAEREENPAAAGGGTFAANRAVRIGKADMAHELRRAAPTARCPRPPAISDCCERRSPQDHYSGRKTRPELHPGHRPSAHCRRPGPTLPGAGPAVPPSARRWPQRYRRPRRPRWLAGNRPACESPDRRGPAVASSWPFFRLLVPRTRRLSIVRSYRPAMSSR